MDPTWQHWEVLKTEIGADLLLSKIQHDITSGEQQHVGFEVQHNLLYYKNRLVIPNTSTLISVILQEFHASLLGGHSRITKTYKKVAAELYRLGMQQDIVRFVHECPVCQQSKYLATTPIGLLQPIPLP